MSRRLVAILLATCVSTGARAQDGDAERMYVGTLTLVGPLESVELACPPFGTTRLAAGLRAGELRRVGVPFAGRSVAAGTEPEVRARRPDTGAVRFEGWRERAEAWGDLPATLRARTPPPVTTVREPPGTAALALLAGTLIAVLGSRRRPPLALAVGCAGALAAFLAQGPAASVGNGTLRFLEGDAASGRWLQVDAARDTLAMDAEPALRLTTVPSSTAFTWSVRLAPGADTIWEARAAGATVLRYTSLAVGPRRFERELNSFGALSACWVRGADGVWTGLGEWGLGRPLPGAALASAAPPGWLASGLPQGAGVLVGRLGDDAFRGAPPRASAPDRTPTWVRLLGF